MNPVTCTSPHLEIQTVKWKLKTAKKHWEKQRWLVIYNGMVDPRSARNIAKHVGVSKGFVHWNSDTWNNGSHSYESYSRSGDSDSSSDNTNDDNTEGDKSDTKGDSQPKQPPDEEVNRAVQEYLSATDGGHVGNRNFWKNAHIPITAAYLDFTTVFVLRFQSE